MLCPPLWVALCRPRFTRNVSLTNLNLVVTMIYLFVSHWDGGFPSNRDFAIACSPSLWFLSVSECHCHPSPGHSCFPSSLSTIMPSCWMTNLMALPMALSSTVVCSHPPSMVCLASVVVTVTLIPTTLATSFHSCDMTCACAFFFFSSYNLRKAQELFDYSVHFSRKFLCYIYLMVKYLKSNKL